MNVNTNDPRLIWRLRVPSKSNPGTFHIVEMYETGDMRCDCWANEHGKVCSHMRKTLVFAKQLVKKMEQKYGEQT